MNMYVFFITIAFFAGMYLFIGKKVSSKVKNCEEYFLGKRKFSFFSTIIIPLRGIQFLFKLIPIHLYLY